MYLDKNFFDWQVSGDILLTDLLTGKAVIIDDWSPTDYSYLDSDNSGSKMA